MTYHLIIRPEAEQDIADGRDWYEGRQDGLGIEFLTAVDEVFDRICETPELYVPEYRAVRRAGLNRFPYIVYYRIVGDSVEVIAVQHGSRHPRQWRSRVE
jgi:plasmid stabilization system protein ParE